MKLTGKSIAALDAIGFNWTSQEYVTRAFDEWIKDLEEYNRSHGHVNMNRNEDESLSRFCAEVRFSPKKDAQNC
jgi:hypothetical protein